MKSNTPQRGTAGVQTTNFSSGPKRQKFESADGNPARQATDSDRRAVMMNTPGMKPRGSRADQLIAMAGTDSYSLGTEAPRRGKMKG